jgi:hypothetical protein
MAEAIHVFPGVQGLAYPPCAALSTHDQIAI